MLAITINLDNVDLVKVFSSISLIKINYLIGRDELSIFVPLNNAAPHARHESGATTKTSKAY